MDVGIRAQPSADLLNTGYELDADLRQLLLGEPIPQKIPEELPKEEISKEEVSKEEVVKEELQKEETSHEEFAKEEIVTEEPQKEEILKEEVPKEEIVKEEAQKEETSAEEFPKKEIVTEEPQKEEILKEEVLTEEIPTGTVPAEEVPTGAVSTEEVPTEAVPPEAAPDEIVLHDEAVPKRAVPNETVPNEPDPNQDETHEASEDEVVPPDNVQDAVRDDIRPKVVPKKVHYSTKPKKIQNKVHRFRVFIGAVVGLLGAQQRRFTSQRRHRRAWLRSTVFALSMVTFIGMATQGIPVLHPLVETSSSVTSWLSAQVHLLDYMFMRGTTRDVLGLLVGMVALLPLMKKLRTSPIIGSLLMGVFLGPSGMNIIQNLHPMHELGELGIIFFLFEMGLELSTATVMAMRFDVFGLGVMQYVGTLFVVGRLVSSIVPSLSSAASLVLGGALALSSSAFVLQLIRDEGQLSARYGRACLGILLFQDIAVVPLLVLLPLLGGSAADVNIAWAAAQAGLRGILAFALIWIVGKTIMTRLYEYVLDKKSTEGFLALTLGTILLSASVTEGLGLSNTLGAFLGGVLLAETNYRHKIEADIAPFRGMLLSLFFVSVGFSIDLGLLVSHVAIILPLILGLLLVKGLVVAGACLSARIPGTDTIQATMLLAPGGEFAFVIFGWAERFGIIPEMTSNILITATALSMGLTPMMATIGGSIVTRLRNRQAREKHRENLRSILQLDYIHSSQQGFVVVCGHGRVGKVVCGLLDLKNVNYFVVAPHLISAFRAQIVGRPVFLGRCTEPEELERFKIGQARLVIVALSNKDEANKVSIAVRNAYPDVDVFVSAEDDEHLEELESKIGVSGVKRAIGDKAPVLSLQFGETILKHLGANDAEVAGIIDAQLQKMRGKSEGEVDDADLIDSSSSTKEHRPNCPCCGYKYSGV